MKRPDFPSGHDGCQAVEAIPQEASAGGTGSSWGDNASGAGGPGGVERAEDAADIGRALDVRSIVNSDGHLIVSPGGDPIGAPTGRDPGGDPPPSEVTLTVQVLEETALGWELTAEVHVARRSTRLRVPEGAHVGRDFISELCFTNPVARALHRVRVRVEGAGVHAPGTILVSDVEGHGRMRMPVVPKRPGKLTLIASLDCTELPQVHGGATFQCEP
ncbi:unnamed protein product [Lampetra fluviatilis]